MASDRGRVKPLTKRTVDASKPEAKRYVVWDDKLKGFGLRVQPSKSDGSAIKSFIVRYRTAGGRKASIRQKVLGRVGNITADQARIAARKLLGAASAGGDPIGDAIKARQDSRTVAEVCDWYFTEVDAGRFIGRRGRAIKPSTIRSDRSRYEAHVKPLIGKKPVSGLELADLERLRGDITTGKTAKQPNGKRPKGALPRGGSGAATRTVAMLSAIFEHAIRAGLITNNPARGVRKAKGKKVTRRLSMEEYRALGEALRTADESPTALDAIRLLALTGLRRTEALALRPEWLREAGGIAFPDTKSYEQLRPIGKPAVQLIKARSGGKWVFPSERGDGHFVGLPRVLARVCKAAKLKGVSLHILRHSFASTAADLGFSELVIGAVLGHRSTSVTGGYVHLDAALVVAADRTAAVIASALDGIESGVVVPLRGSA